MRKEKVFAFFQFIIDLCIIVVSYYGVFYLKKFFGKPYSLPNLIAMKSILPYLLIVFVVFFFVYGLYKIEELDFYETFLGIIFSSIILAIFAFAFSFWFRAFAVPRSMVMYSFIVQILLLSVFHYFAYRIYLRLTPPVRALIISSTEEKTREIGEYIKAVKGDRVRIVEQVLNKDSMNVIEGKLDNFDIFIISDDFDSKKKEEIVKFFAFKGKPFYVVPGIYELMLLNPKSHLVGDKMLLEISVANVRWFDRFAKRTLDIIVSVIALVVFSPLILIISILILIDSGRPIYYLQKRAGINGEIFETIKFRTMVKDAEKDTGAILSNENDTRVTKTGRFLRRTGFDEIPQFVNVLKGEMSVVGPRPERPELINEIKQDVPDFDLRLKVKPGITGFAQLAGKYDTPFEEKLKMDLVYGKQKFLFFTDIYVMLNTIKLFFLPKKRK